MLCVDRVQSRSVPHWFPGDVLQSDPLLCVGSMTCCGSEGFVHEGGGAHLDVYYLLQQQHSKHHPRTPSTVSFLFQYITLFPSTPLGCFDSLARLISQEGGPGFLWGETLMGIHSPLIKQGMSLVSFTLNPPGLFPIKSSNYLVRLSYRQNAYIYASLTGCVPLLRFDWKKCRLRLII